MLKLKLEQNDKLGFYTVGDKKFYSKPMALMEATQTNQFPHWNFNNNVFDNLNYTQCPETPLLDLYRIRAQQLRDKYDYIRLELSGGSDSVTALYSFVNNNIHIDEVVVKYPKTGEKNVEDDPFNHKPENTLSEFKYAALPVLNWLKTRAPRTKITIYDYSVDMLTTSYDEGWVLNTKDYFQPGHAFKHNPIAAKEHKELADSGKNICVLYGVDKPKVCIKDKKWYMYFIDVIANHSVGTVGDYTNLTNEYFFWTPDLPELVLKQAHIVINWFNLPQNQYLQYLCRWPNYSYTQRSAYEHIVKPLIYPHYDPTTFQTNKPSNSFYNEMDYWFYTNLKDTDQYRIWKAGLRFLVDKIDPKFFNYEMGEPVGFVGFLSPFHYLGEAEFVDSGINIHNRF
jgi:hypothetical protein